MCAFEEPASLGHVDLQGANEDIRARIHELLLLSHRPGHRPERRSDRRYPYPYLVRLSPADEEGATPGEQIIVAGKSLSERGFGFYHPHPLPYRRMVASFHAGDGRWVRLLIDLPWCRFTAEGWYESGGRFLQCLPAAHVQSEPPNQRSST